MIKVNQHALINQMRPNFVLVRPTEKVGRKSTTSRKNESRSLFSEIDALPFNKKKNYFILSNFKGNRKKRSLCGIAVLKLIHRISCHL